MNSAKIILADQRKCALSENNRGGGGSSGSATEHGIKASKGRQLNKSCETGNQFRLDYDRMAISDWDALRRKADVLYSSTADERKGVFMAFRKYCLHSERKYAIPLYNVSEKHKYNESTTKRK